MASETPASVEPVGEHVNVDDGIAPQATSKIKWNVRGGGDRTHVREIDHVHQLEGSPNIQGITVSESPRVTLYAYVSSDGSGPAALTVLGPTHGEVPNNPVRIGSFLLKLRD